MTFRRKSYLSKHTCSGGTTPAAETGNQTKAPGGDTQPAEYILVQVKVAADKYRDFLEYMRLCPHIYQEEAGVPTTTPDTYLRDTRDTAIPMRTSPPPAQTDITSSVDPLLSPEAQDYLDPLSIPLARDILGGPMSQAPETFTEVTRCEDVWMQTPGELTPQEECTTIDMDLFSEFISNL
jgi:hypothetical protein